MKQSQSKKRTTKPFTKADRKQTGIKKTNPCHWTTYFNEGEKQRNYCDYHGNKFNLKKNHDMTFSNIVKATTFHAEMDDLSGLVPSHFIVFETPSVLAKYGIYYVEIK